jgi:ABC-2 type transport system ATP-binding protein
MPHAIEASDLRKDYAGEHALDGVSLAVTAGALFGLIGADGAGKTTLLRILATLITPDAGAGSVLGFDIARDPQRIRSAIGYMPQRFSLYEDLTVRENMLFFADVFGVRGAERTERLERLLQFSRLGAF